MANTNEDMIIPLINDETDKKSNKVANNILHKCIIYNGVKPILSFGFMLIYLLHLATTNKNMLRRIYPNFEQHLLLVSIMQFSIYLLQKKIL